VTKPFSLAFKQKMVARLTGNDAMSARQLALETGLRQQTLSRWVQESWQRRARELARKEKALSEAATLLVLKKKVQALEEDEDIDTDEEHEP